MFLFSGPSSTEDFLLLYSLYMLLPVLVVMGILNIILKDTNYYKLKIKEQNIFRLLIYYSILFLLANIITIIGFWIITIL